MADPIPKHIWPLCTIQRCQGSVEFLANLRGVMGGYAGLGQGETAPAQVGGTGGGGGRGVELGRLRGKLLSMLLLLDWHVDDLQQRTLQLNV